MLLLGFLSFKGLGLDNECSFASQFINESPRDRANLLTIATKIYM